MNSRLLLWSITASLAGFLFGFDTVVISGVEKTLQDLWTLSDAQHGWMTSIALWGTVLGALIGGIPTERLGRKNTLLAVGVMYFVSAGWCAIAGSVVPFMIARFIGGVGVGISTVAAPLYISEIAPPAYRGRLAGMFQFNIVFGILVAFGSNWGFNKYIETDAWRWMVDIEALPAAIFTMLAFGLPESPRWLLRNGRRDEGLAVLARTQPELPDEQRLAIAGELVASGDNADDAPLADRMNEPKPRLGKPLVLAFLIAMFNQLSGINAILYFAPRIFKATGLDEQSALLESIGIGVTNLIFTFVGLWLIDRLGRKTLLLIGSVGYIVSLGACAWAFSSQRFGIVPPCIFLFIAAHAVGQGAVIWVFISEIFPDRYRAAGQALGSSTHWVFAALITLVFPIAIGSVPPAAIFGFFCGMMVLQLVWVLTMVPETKGRSLEQIEADLGVSPAA